MPSCSKYCAPSQELEHERNTRPADASKNGSTAAAGQGISNVHASDEHRVYTWPFAPRRGDMPLGPIERFDFWPTWARFFGYVIAAAAIIGVLAAVADAALGAFVATFEGRR